MMRQLILKVAFRVHRTAEVLSALMLAIMFVSFLVTVLFRYVLNLPAGWASELSTVMWVWLVLFGAAFLVREKDEIRFDILYSSVGPKVQRVMTFLFSIGIVTLFLVSLPAVYDYVTFMKVQSTSYLEIRFDWLYSIYVVFAVGIIFRYLWLGLVAVLGYNPVTVDKEDNTERRN